MTDDGARQVLTTAVEAQLASLRSQVDGLADDPAKAKAVEELDKSIAALDRVKRANGEEFDGELEAATEANAALERAIAKGTALPPGTRRMILTATSDHLAALQAKVAGLQTGDKKAAAAGHLKKAAAALEAAKGGGNLDAQLADIGVAFDAAEAAMEGADPKKEESPAAKVHWSVTAVSFVLVFACLGLAAMCHVQSQHDDPYVRTACKVDGAAAGTSAVLIVDGKPIKIEAATGKVRPKQPKGTKAQGEVEPACDTAVKHAQVEHRLARKRSSIGVFVFAGLFVVSGALAIGYRKKGGLLKPAIGTDRRISTSLLQTLLWTMIIVTALLWAVIVSSVDGQPSLETLLGDDWDGYLVLLGGPFAAAVIAKASTSYKVANGQVQKVDAVAGTVLAPPTVAGEAPAPAVAPPAPGAAPSPADQPAPNDAPSLGQAGQDDSGAASLIDLQYLLFNLIAMGYVITQSFQDHHLPVIPTVLFTLCGTSAALYAGTKAAAANPTSITSVVPASARPGDTVTVYGQNFIPVGSSKLRWPVVSVNGAPFTISPTTYTDSKIEFVLPAGTSGGNTQISVTSCAGVASMPAAFVVESIAPSISSLNGEAFPGATYTVTGEGLTEHVRVAGRDQRVEVQRPASGPASLKVSLPADVVSGDVPIDFFGADDAAVTTRTVTIAAPTIQLFERTDNGRLKVTGLNWWMPGTKPDRERPAKLTLNGFLVEVFDSKHIEHEGNVCSVIIDTNDHGVMKEAKAAVDWTKALEVTVLDEFARLIGPKKLDPLG